MSHLVYVGGILLIFVMVPVFSMVDSMNTYKVKETPDECLLYQRVEDLERDMIIFKELVNSLVKEVKLQTEYVKLDTYRRDILLLKDEQSIIQKDIREISNIRSSSKL